MSCGPWQPGLDAVRAEPWSILTTEPRSILTTAQVPGSLRRAAGPASPVRRSDFRGEACPRSEEEPDRGRLPLQAERAP